MAKVTAVGFDELAKELNTIADHTGSIASAALYEGSGYMADQIRHAVDALQTDDRKHATNHVLEYEKEALSKGLTIEKFKQDTARGVTQTAITFHGYSDHKTDSYPTGAPTILLARAITKGTSFRRPNRFFPNAVNRSRKATEDIMVKKAEEEMRKDIK